jgi:hypothetical protein
MPEVKDDALRFSGNLFFHLVRTDKGARALLLAPPDVFPWVRFLPKQDVQAFLGHLRCEDFDVCSELAGA